MRQFTLVTGNENKAAEYRAMLQGVEVDIENADVDEIQSNDLEEIARKKARAAFAILKKPVVVDDTGFYLEHWKGLPGPFMKHFVDKFGRETLIRILGDAENRRGYARTCIAYCDGKEEFVVSGEVYGTVTHELRGPEGAFGFDYCFIPDGYDKTMAELGTEVKHKISHRARALQAFKERIETL